MLLVPAMIFIASLIPSEQFKRRNRKNKGEFMVVPQVDPFIEFEENDFTLNNFQTVMSKEEWNHRKDHLKAIPPTIRNKTPVTKDPPSVFCRKLKTCHECGSSKKSCSWCHNSGCSDHKTCKNKNRNCPAIEHRGKISVPAGIDYKISVKLTSSDPDLIKMLLLCVVRKGDRLIYLPVKYLSGAINCETHVFDTDVYGDVDAASLRVLWGGFQQYSNELKMVILRCHTMAMDCASCGILPREYGCGWCNQLNYCTTAAQCGPDTTKWSVKKCLK